MGGACSDCGAPSYRESYSQTKINQPEVLKSSISAPLTQQVGYSPKPSSFQNANFSPVGVKRSVSPLPAKSELFLSLQGHPSRSFSPSPAKNESYSQPSPPKKNQTRFPLPPSVLRSYVDSQGNIIPPV